MKGFIMNAHNAITPATVESLLNGSNPRLNDLISEKRKELDLHSATTIKVDSPRTRSLTQINNELARLADDKSHIQQKIDTINNYIAEQLAIGNQIKEKILEDFNNDVQKTIMELGGNTLEGVTARIAQHKFYLEQLEARLAEGNFDEPTDEFLNKLATLVAKKDKRYDKIVLQYDNWAVNKVASEIDGLEVAGKSKKFGLKNRLTEIDAEIQRLEAERNKITEVKTVEEKYDIVKEDVTTILEAKTTKPSKKKAEPVADDELSDEIAQLLNAK